MYANSEVDKNVYVQAMQGLKLQNKKIKMLEQSKAGKWDKIICVLKSRDWTKIKKYSVNQIMQKKVKRKFNEIALHNTCPIEPNYFLEDRVAVYTCITGAYDKIAEPLFCPDNCDFYIVTDQDVSGTSAWKKIEIDRQSEELKDLSNVEINRYFKMHPHILFPKYRYSIYLDGNIQPISDLTEFVNLIGKSGIAAHRHSFRNCVYKEAEVLVYLKKDDPKRIREHVNYLKNSEMPENYGLIECNVIAREHHNSVCKAVMKSWWEEFLKHSKRDQISFVHALYVNGVSVDDVATLGNNVFENDAIKKYGHE